MRRGPTPVFPKQVGACGHSLATIAAAPSAACLSRIASVSLSTSPHPVPRRPFRSRNIRRSSHCAPAVAPAVATFYRRQRLLLPAEAPEERKRDPGGHHRDHRSPHHASPFHLARPELATFPRHPPPSARRDTSPRSPTGLYRTPSRQRT